MLYGILHMVVKRRKSADALKKPKMFKCLLLFLNFLVTVVKNINTKLELNVFIGKVEFTHSPLPPF